MIQAETEARSTDYATVETWPDEAILTAIVDGQRRAAEACAAAIGPIGEAASRLAQVWRQGGRIGYAGAGSSGIIALLDALELPCTFGLDAGRIPVLLAGGAASLAALDQGSEDDDAASERAFAASTLGGRDALIAVSASGATPHTLAVARAARTAGCVVIGIACAAGAPLLALADVPILLRTGPEIIAGSTRMNAGTAQKCALNMISTLVGIRLHHVFAGMMVNVRAENAKLRLRATEMVAEASGATRAVAAQALEHAGWEVKPAIMAAAGANPADIPTLLDTCHGDLHAALTRLRPLGTTP